MADNVNSKFTADASQMHKEFEKMQDKMASMANQIDKLTSKSKTSGREGKQAFRGMGDELNSMVKSAVGVTAIFSLIKSGISAVIEKTKELRALRDESAISTSSSLNKVFKEYKLEGTDQNKMQGWMQGQAQAQKMKLERLAQFVEAGANEGMKKEDLYSGKYKSAIDLFNVNEKLSGEQGVNLLQTGLRKKGKSFETATKSDVDEVSSFLSTTGGDIATLDTELGQLDKKIPFEEAVVLIDMAKKNRYGKGKKSASDINEGYKKGGLDEAIKSAGYESKTQFYDDLANAREDAKTALGKKQGIQKSSREAELNYSENAKQFASEEVIRNQELERARKNNRLAKEEAERSNLVTRTYDDFLGNNVGEENISTVKKIADNPLLGTTPPVLMLKLLNAITGTGEKIETQNLMLTKEKGDEPVSTNNDSKRSK